MYDDNSDNVSFSGTPNADTMTLTPGQTTNGSATVSFAGMEITNVFAGDGNDTVDASASVDPVNLYGDQGDDHLIGGSGTDSLIGDGYYWAGCLCAPDTGNDTLEGNGGSDYLGAGGGADTMSGGAGGDYYYSIVVPGCARHYPPGLGRSARKCRRLAEQ